MAVERALSIIKPDAVFNIIHGDPGENGVLAKILERNNIPQTGCNNYVSQLTFNKKKYIELSAIFVISFVDFLVNFNNASYIPNVSNNTKSLNTGASPQRGRYP